MDSIKKLLDELQANGRVVFSTDEAVSRLGRSPPAIRAQIRRLKSKGEIADPYRGFHVIIPPQYRRLGCLPAEQFVPQLMAHLGEPYYVALLSAATYFGASHQVPQVFQVVVRKARRRISCGGVEILFVARADMEATATVHRNTPASVLTIASPAATALELVGYPEHCGYLDNVATVLADLAEALEPDALAAEAKRAPMAWVQRLGYLFSVLEQHVLKDALANVLKPQTLFPVPLAPWRSMTGFPRDPIWRVAVNETVEPDL